ncbi:uncharacterized protein [Ptychodera flava]|uniref:uncharacterized protein n=1 Tax=Ptychodera flava TaxID=63121 RepID=UPI00396A09BE
MIHGGVIDACSRCEGVCIDHGQTIYPRYECRESSATVSTRQTTLLPNIHGSPTQALSGLPSWIYVIIVLSAVINILVLVAVSYLWKKQSKPDKTEKILQKLELIDNRLKDSPTQTRGTSDRDYSGLGNQEERQSMLPQMQTAQVQIRNNEGVHYSTPANL